MSDLIFPTLRGVYLEERIPFFSTTVGASSTGVEFRIAEREVGFRYVLAVSFLRTEYSEHTTLFDFFIARRGSYDSFLYVDPVDGVTRRVRFNEDELDLRKGKDAVWSGSVELITVPG